MVPDRPRDRIAAQFAGSSERADVWRVFDRVLATDAFLNLGYSRWYQPHVLGAPQRRLATVVGEHLAAHLPRTAGRSLLDVGCGRGGPATCLATEFGFDVLGVDLVRANVARARANATRRRASAARTRQHAARTRPTTAAGDSGVDAGSGRTAFVVGDATRLPVRPGSMRACTAVDALVYLPDRAAAVAELATVLEPGGVLVLTDLFARPDLDGDARDAIARFADAWDLAPPASRAAYARKLESAGFDVRVSRDLSAHSVGRFRRWTAPVVRLADGPLRRAMEWPLAHAGLDAEVIVEQVRRAHDALPWLRHGLLVAEKRG